MNKKEIEELLKHAQQYYSSGKYEEALQSWRKVLEQDSDNKQALEGVRMAEVISKNWLSDESHPSEETENAAEEGAEDLLASNLEKTEDEEQAAEERQTTVAVAMAEGDAGKEAPEAAKGDSTDEQVHEIIMEAENLIKEKNYVEAIERLSEAWSLDEMNLAVQDLMNIARSLLEIDNTKIQEKLATAIEEFEKKEYNTAEELFKEILSINPSHMEALSYLGKIDQERKNADTDKATTSYIDEGAFEQEKSIEDDLEVTSSAEGEWKIGEEKTEEGAGDWKEEPVEQKTEEGAGEWTEETVEQKAEEGTGEWTEEPVEQKQERVQAKTAAPVVSRKRSYTWILYPLLVVIIVAAGIYFSRDFIYGLFMDSSTPQTDSVSGNSKAGVAIPIPPVTQEPDSGESNAETLATESSSAGQIQETDAGQVESASVNVNLSSLEIKAKVQELIREGKTLVSSGQPFEAQKKFKEAMLLDPLSIQAKRLHADTSRVVAELKQKDEKMNNAMQLFEQEQYEEALKLFYRLPGSNKDPIQRYIMNSWYNLGILNLKSSNIVEAKKCFEEVLLLNPYDQNAQQEMKFTEWYTSHRVDESFGHHVKTLTYRKITD